MTDTRVSLTTYPYRSLDSIYSTTLLAHTHTQSMHPTYMHTHSTSYIHTQIGKGVKERRREKEEKREGTEDERNKRGSKTEMGVKRQRMM